MTRTPRSDGMESLESPLPILPDQLELVEDEHEPNPVIDFMARLIIALAIYVASIGPMYWPWFRAKYLNGWWIIAGFYEPLFLMAGWIPPLGRWLNWYICQWIY